MHSVYVLALATTLSLLSACGQHQATIAPTDLAADRAPASDPTPSTISLEKIGQFAGGGPGAAEITAFDAVSQRLFVVNGAQGTVDVLDLRTPSSPRKLATLSVARFGASANSVATHGGVVAVAIEAFDKQARGTVAFYRATTLELISSAQVGALPDMLTFSKSGRYVLVANEGEPSGDYLKDPEGSVSVIDVSNVNAPIVAEAGFVAFNGQAEGLRAAGVRIFGPNASVAQDLEPEYITIDDDEQSAWVTLQENNALAVVDIPTATVRQIVPLGFKHHALAGNGLDVSDRDGPAGAALVNIRTWAVPLFGMYQPDAIASYTVNGQTYLVTANEGDARGYPAFAEEQRVGALPLDASLFTAAACGGDCTSSAGLGRLTVTSTLGRNGTAFDALYAFGARSFSIWTAHGQLVWDSGDQLEQLTRALPMAAFNAGHAGNALDDRSDDKGPEPEGLALGRLGEKTFAFIGLERIGGVAVYDVTVPTSPVHVTYVNSRDGASGDLGPEGVTFVPAGQSPSREPLLIVGNEVSGTTAIYRIKLR